jgi:predicted ABC-type ATPase
MSDNSEKKRYIIAGPNGAGKTTFALEYLPQVAGCTRFINADLIAAGLSPLAPERELMAASRLFLREIGSALQRGKRSPLKPPWRAEPTCVWSSACNATAGGWS